MSAVQPPHRPLYEEEIRALAPKLGEPDDADLVELLPHRSIRTFRLGAVTLRVDEDPNSLALQNEALALRTFQTATDPPIVPAPLAHEQLKVANRQLAWIAYPWVPGHTLSREEAAERAGEVGALFAHLHGARVFDLQMRLQRHTPLTLMASFRKASDALRGWTLEREGEGLGQDLLTLTLTDLHKAMRRFALSLDHLFIPAQRRVVCHGRPRPDLVVAQPPGNGVAPLQLVSLDQVALGDPSDDLALFSVRAGLTDDAEDRLLFSYLDTLDQLGRRPQNFIPRYFARRALHLFHIPVARLAFLRRVKNGDALVLRDPVVTIEEEAERTYQALVNAINGLRDLVGGMRPVSLLEVKSMGRLIAYEEMLLVGRSFTITLGGAPYAGKTQVGSTLARRLKHNFISTGALGRALALFESEVLAEHRDDADPSAAELVSLFFDAGFAMHPTEEEPYYQVKLGDRDISREIQADGHRARAQDLLADEAIVRALRDALALNLAPDGVVVEGKLADSITVGRVRRFFLTCDDEVRRSRLLGHRLDVDSPKEAADLLTALDKKSPAPHEDSIPVDLGSRAPGAAALSIIWHLLPPQRQQQIDQTELGGRPVLFQS
jgi:cytidylate kinase